MRVFDKHSLIIITLSVLCSLAVAVIVFCPIHLAHTDGSPMLPQVFRGTVTVNGVLAGAGVNVTVKTGNNVIATTITDSQGRYGYLTDFMVSANPGASMDFFVNGQNTGQSYTFSSGNITTLDLVLGTSTSSYTGAKTITTSILGQSGSFNLSQSGAVSSPTELSNAGDTVRILLSVGTSVGIAGQSLNVTSSSLAPPVPPANTALINVYDFAPNNTTFSPAIGVIFKYDTAALPQGVAESNLYVAFWDGSAWSTVASVVDTANKTVSAQVSHFTLYAVLGGIGSTPPVTTPPATAPTTTTPPATAPTTTTPPSTTTPPATTPSATAPSTAAPPSMTTPPATSPSTTVSPSTTTPPVTTPPSTNLPSTPPPVTTPPAATPTASTTDNTLLMWGLIAAGIVLIILLAVILIRRRSY